MALDELVFELDGSVLADLRLVITEMVTTIIRSGTGAPLSVHVEVLSRLRLRGEVAEESDALRVHSPLADEAAPILDELTSRWGVGPHPRCMWFEIEA